MSQACPLCKGDGGLVVARTPSFRVVRVVDGEEARRFPAFYRLIWAAHVAEFSDLSAEDRNACMDAVVRIEQVLRSLLAPTKVNLATLGNVVPHLHWHVIARFDWDSHFPAPVWAAAQRDEVPGGAASRLALPLQAVDAAVAQALTC
ncbi:HIT family protein [Roseateles saccharophilus]|uniref:Diadenosine tetraphosphate (Ap4A) HIT family hydrolase n=1 Tax=Roseateles saccharophilus TaxID=304 RepID=A0A4R3UQM6_ROSSA|nr:HIT family protein [Roseateles saccharophilus]MDG0833446.1 HIT family protein [Roseateles saccharophilus]TCU93101.1 diadenosine tetraphosphate (Ap4A) HIT family hydrolase [Roseateles saccharophilus]